MRTAAGRRAFTYLRGRGAERIALLWLLAKGYRPLARRYAAAGGEIDLIVRRGSTIAFVEVKARASLAQAAASVPRRQQARLMAAAEAWLAGHPGHGAAGIRFDVILVAPEGMRRIADAFRAWA